MATAHQELQTLWAEAYDAWKDVPGHSTPTVYFCPEAASSVPPEGLADKIVCATTKTCLSSFSSQPPENSTLVKHVSHTGGDRGNR